MDGWWRGKTAGYRVVDLPDIIGAALIEIATAYPPQPDVTSDGLIESPLNPVTLLAELLRTMPEADALTSARASMSFEGARISARLSLHQILERAWGQIEARA